MSDGIEIREASFESESDMAKLFGILDAYARGPGGQNAPLPEIARENLMSGLASNTNMFVLFGVIDDEILGAAVSLWGFSTFGGRPYLNLHDFSVLPKAQGRGIGTALLKDLERRARERNCCKMTLEVHDTNDGAKRLYARMGFTGWESPTLFVAKPL